MALRLWRHQIQLLNSCNKTATSKSPFRSSSSKKASMSNDNVKITVTAYGSAIVCWHPEPEFPYEFSRPLPEQEETHSVLKVQNLDSIRSVFKEKNEEFVRQELMAITHTTKHRWFPRGRDRYAKNTPPDRDYL